MWRWMTRAIARLALGVMSLAALAAEPTVPYVPTPQEVVDRMLAMARVTPNDYLIDLGSGDGRIVVTAAKKHGVTESATVGATSAANIGTVVSPQVAIGRRNIGNKSYTGSPGKSGTKAPKLPKIVQPKNKDGTAKNALDIKGSSLFGGPIKSKAKTKNKKR